jgi:hypothetical protein
MKSGVGVDKLRNPAATATHRFDQGARHHAEAAHGSMCERHTKGVETRRAAGRGEASEQRPSGGGVLRVPWATARRGRVGDGTNPFALAACKRRRLWRISMLCSAAAHAATLRAAPHRHAVRTRVRVSRGAMHAMLRRIDGLPIIRRAPRGARARTKRSVAAASKAHPTAAQCRRKRRRPVLAKPRPGSRIMFQRGIPALQCMPTRSTHCSAAGCEIGSQRLRATCLEQCCARTQVLP